MRCGCLLLLIAFGFIWGGGQGVYTALTNRSPTERTLAEYEKDHGTAAWVTLKGCRFDLSEAMTRESDTGARELWVPVTRADAAENDRVHVVVKTKDEELSRAYRDLVNALKKSEGLGTWIVENRERIQPVRDISGLVQFGIELDEKEHAQIAKLDKRLVKNFVIVEHGEEPRLAGSAGMLLIGVVCLLIFIGLVAMNDDEDDEDEEPSDEGEPAPDTA